MFMGSFNDENVAKKNYFCSRVCWFHAVSPSNPWSCKLL